MKREQITVKTPDGYTVKVPAQLLATAVIAALLGHTGSVSLPAPTTASLDIEQVPALGEYWPGQGGHNAGLVAASDGVPAHYLIVSAEDLGAHEWGGRGKESAATSKLDGLANTLALVESGDHQAANEAASYEADGHTDFYLPAAGELYHCWLHVADLFRKDCYYWSSSQRSAYYAFYMYFDAGRQYDYVKDDELRVRPVRRFFI